MTFVDQAELNTADIMNKETIYVLEGNMKYEKF